jgi:threonine synthase
VIDWTAEPDSWDGGWNPRARLRCMHCGDLSERSRAVRGCPACAAGDGPAPLEVIYTDGDGPAPDNRPRLDSALGWLAVHHQPIAPSAVISIGRPVTPLVRQQAFGPSVYIKNETLNPTWGHKDRLHEVAAGVARLISARGLVASSTGNHGAAAAAHAAVAGLPSVIFCHLQASPAAVKMITAYGGLAVQVTPSEAREALAGLVDDGWFPATSMDPAVSGRSNPYGAEGYKTLSLEVTRQLGELPGTVIVPTASGDTLYGIAKGFAEISELTGEPMPLMVSAQPEGGDPLARSIAAGQPVTVPDPHSMALSVADPFTGRHALAAIRRWGGQAVSVREDAIVDAVRQLAAAGLLAEPASAVALAGLWRLRDAGHLTPHRAVVLILTSAGVKWPGPIEEIFPDPPLRSLNALFGRLSRQAPSHAPADAC